MAKIVDAPPWLVSLATPFIARMIVRELVKQHPDWSHEQIAAKLRADLGRDPGPRDIKLLAEVLRRWPKAARPTPRFSLSAAVLVAANLVALYGILRHGWDVFPLILLYWIENVILGVLNVARMLCVDPEDRATWLGKLFTVPFFCVHYGLFTAGHGSILLGIFGKGYDSEGLNPLPG